MLEAIKTVLITLPCALVSAGHIAEGREGEVDGTETLHSEYLRTYITNPQPTEFTGEFSIINDRAEARLFSPLTKIGIVCLKRAAPFLMERWTKSSPEDSQSLMTG